MTLASLATHRHGFIDARKVESVRRPFSQLASVRGSVLELIDCPARGLFDSSD